VFNSHQSRVERIAEENNTRLSGPVEGQGKSYLSPYRVGDIGHYFVHKSDHPFGSMYGVGFQFIVSSLSGH